VSRGILGGYEGHLAKAVRAACRELKADRERERIARLTRNDAASIMARIIATRTLQCGQVSREDFLQGGIPADFIDEALPKAFARARAREPRLDRMVLA
jgi:hypothetical protein